MIDESEDGFQEQEQKDHEQASASSGADTDNAKQSDLNFEQVIQRRNAQVVNCTTPAQYFHVLRRQVHREFRKPLIVVSPKNMLRHKHVVSPLSDFESGTRFRRVIGEEVLSEEERSEVQKIVFCSGKVYYDLFEERERLRKQHLEDPSVPYHQVALVRVEQVAPFPFDSIKRELAKYDPKVATRLVWCQEEPRNQGCYSYMSSRLRNLEKHCHQTIFKQSESMNGSSSGLIGESCDCASEREIEYVGRRVSASSATGLGMRAHQAELNDMFRHLFFE
jgi:2-oxoglutarate dehydrogenase E1 component